MSLTKTDLQSIKQLIDNSIDERVQPMLNNLEKRLTDKIDDLTLDVGKFSLETTENFNKLHVRVDDVSEKLAAVADMTDYNRVEIRKLKRKPGLI